MWFVNRPIENFRAKKIWKTRNIFPTFHHSLTKKLVAHARGVHMDTNDSLSIPCITLPHKIYYRNSKKTAATEEMTQKHWTGPNFAYYKGFFEGWNRSFWRNCRYKATGWCPFPPLKPRKFTTITSDSGYLLNRPQNQIIFRHLNWKLWKDNETQTKICPYPGLLQQIHENLVAGYNHDFSLLFWPSNPGSFG